MSSTFHAMIDLETLGVRHTAPVLQIGLASQGTEVGDVMESWTCHVNLVSQTDRPIETDALRWWLAATPRSQWFLDYMTRIEDFPGITNAVLGLGRTLKQAINDSADYLIWTKGSMDMAILDNICERYSGCSFAELFGFNFRRFRDFRTMLDIGKRKGIVTTDASLPSGAEHCAEQDARAQLAELIRIWKELGL